MPICFGIVTGQKNTTLRAIAWRYSEDDEEVRNALLDACVRRAGDKARRIAVGLGVTLTGIRRFTEGYEDPESGIYELSVDALADSDFAPRRRAPSFMAEDLGMKVSHSKRLRVSVHVEYRVSGFAASAGQTAS